MVIVCEIAAGVRDYSCVNKEGEINNIIACVSSILCICDNLHKLHIIFVSIKI